MTAVELTFNPTDATMMAKASIQTFGPLNSTLFLCVYTKI